MACCLTAWSHYDGSVQDCSNSSALTVELLQSCAKPSITKYWLAVNKICWKHLSAFSVELLLLAVTDVTNAFENITINANTFRLRENGYNFADDIFGLILLEENLWVSIKILIKYIPNGPINNKPALVLIMASCQKVTSHHLSNDSLVYCCIYVPLGLNELKSSLSPSISEIQID